MLTKHATTPRQPQPVFLLEDITAALTVDQALVYTGLDGDTRRCSHGDWYGHRCPTEYHGKSKRAFTVDPDRKLWICNVHGFGGNLLKLIALHEGLRTSGKDFVRVMAIAAEVAGVPARRLTAEERTERIAAARAKEERDARERLQRMQWERAWAVDHATAYWNALPTRTKTGAGERYLRQRGLAGAVERGLVRFDTVGELLSAGVRDSLAIPLFGDDGAIVNVRRRRLPQYVHGEDGQRFSPLPSIVSAYNRGSYVGAVSDVQAGRDVVLCEGFADSITSALAWPTATTIGAQSASHLPVLAKQVAPRIARHGGRMLICPHADNDGIAHAIRAGEVAIESGLRIDETLLVVRYPSADLNDSWCQGWRP